MADHYIFDLYGTLVDIHTNESNPYLWKKLSLYMSLQGAVYAPSELKKAYKVYIQAERSKNLAFGRKLYPFLTEDEVEVDLHGVIRNLFARKKVMPSEDQIMDWAVLFRTLSLQKLNLFPDAENLLANLKANHKKVYLLSNAQRLFTWPEMCYLGIDGYFDDILYSSDIGYTKPSSLFYQALLSKHRINPEDAVMIGNDDQADNHGASRMGIRSYYIQTEQSPKRTSPLPSDCTEITSLSELFIP